ncbi:MAG: CBS domain-containing protein [Roseiarcus sp.]
MSVARILKEKGRDVQTVQPHQTLMEVVAQLAERRLGALVVSDHTRAPLGIISERDIVRVIAEHGAAALEDPVSTHMTRDVQTVGEDASIDHVMTVMTNHRFRHMPVVAAGKLIGIVSIGDIVRRHVDQLQHEREALREYIATA